MVNEFISEQSVEVTSGEASHELVFKIGLVCTKGPTPGYFDPRFGGEPPCGPEFDISTIEVDVTEVPGADHQHKVTMPPWQISWEQLVTIVGQDTANYLFDSAYCDAVHSGEFY